MVRIIGFFVGLFFGVMALWAFGIGLYTQLTSPPEKTAASVFHRQPRELRPAQHDRADVAECRSVCAGLLEERGRPLRIAEE